MAHFKKRELSERNVDDWLMTYADMITLLLCFFAIFLSITITKDKDKLEQAQSEIREKFSSQSDQIKEGKMNVPENSEGNPGSDLPYKNLPSIIDKFSKGEGGEGFNEGKGPENDTGFKKPPPGDRLTTLEMPSAAFFGRGSADLSDEGEAILMQVLNEKLKSADLSGYQITVEGHTDDSPIRNFQFPSNWELSAARAAAVVRFFVNNGIDAKRLRAVGYADSHPKRPNRDAAGNVLPDNQAQNRRVVIKLEKVDKVN